MKVQSAKPKKEERGLEFLINFIDVNFITVYMEKVNYEIDIILKKRTTNTLTRKLKEMNS